MPFTYINVVVYEDRHLEQRSDPLSIAVDLSALISVSYRLDTIRRIVLFPAYQIVPMKYLFAHAIIPSDTYQPLLIPIRICLSYQDVYITNDIFHVALAETNFPVRPSLIEIPEFLEYERPTTPFSAIQPTNEESLSNSLQISLTHAITIEEFNVRPTPIDNVLPDDPIDVYHDFTNNVALYNQVISPLILCMRSILPAFEISSVTFVLTMPLYTKPEIENHRNNVRSQSVPFTDPGIFNVPLRVAATQRDPRTLNATTNTDDANSNFPSDIDTPIDTRPNTPEPLPVPPPNAQLTPQVIPQPTTNTYVPRQFHCIFIKAISDLTSPDIILKALIETCQEEIIGKNDTLVVDTREQLSLMTFAAKTLLDQAITTTFSNVTAHYVRAYHQFYLENPTSHPTTQFLCNYDEDNHDDILLIRSITSRIVAFHSKYDINQCMYGQFHNCSLGLLCLLNLSNIIHVSIPTRLLISAIANCDLIPFRRPPPRPVDETKPSTFSNGVQTEPINDESQNESSPTMTNDNDIVKIMIRRPRSIRTLTISDPIIDYQRRFVLSDSTTPNRETRTYSIPTIAVAALALILTMIMAPLIQSVI
jgi:hypothetical protein